MLLSQVAQLWQTDRATHAPAQYNLMTGGVALYCNNVCLLQLLSTCYSRLSPPQGVFQRGVNHFEHKLQMEGGVAHQPLLVSENYSDCLFEWYQNIRSGLFGFVTKHACDRQTDGRIELRLQRRR